METERIVSNSGEPFKTKGAAALAARHKDMDFYDIVEHEGGFALVENNEKKAVKSATAPWKQAENPWVPDRFRVNKRSGFRNKFITPDNLEKRIDEGWKVADAKDYGIHREQDEGQVDGMVRRRGMILVEMPEELAKQRDEFFSNLTDKRSRDAREIARTAGNRLKSQGMDMDVEMD